MSDSPDLQPPVPDGVNRRSFLRSSGLVAGSVAVTVITPTAVVALEETASAAPVEGGGSPLPAEPVMAYVSDAKRGEVTVLSGLQERTYRDPVLARRLLKAARSQTN
jgi:hypothetical protein